MDNQMLRLHMHISHIVTLGPFVRYGIWTQGCCRRCRGCMTPESQPTEGGILISTEELAERVLSFHDHEGITISGGEPFLQAPALTDLIDKIREKENRGVILYTGFTLEELRDGGAPGGSQELLSRIDLLIDGPYMEELNDDASLRGSSNQRIIALTDRYKDYLELYGKAGGREIDIKVITDGLCVVGIPSRAAEQSYYKIRGVK